MKSAGRGTPISEVEVTNISGHGFWLLLRDQEHFLSFEHFPWFNYASVGHISNVGAPRRNHLYWPLLDVDLAVESIDHPERFPLVSNVGQADAPTPPS